MSRFFSVWIFVYGAQFSGCFIFEGETDDGWNEEGNGSASSTCSESEGHSLDAAWAAKECAVFDLVNQRRAEGADCGSEGTFGSASPLKLHSALREAAGLHSRDMGERDYFSHDSPGGPNGDDMVDRVENAGYVSWSAIGENISAGRSSAEETMAGWMASPGHCANIMNPNFTEIGVGYAEVAGSENVSYWTQDFGRR